MTNNEPSRGPLHGLRVVEIAGLGPAPFAAMLLADLGADVIRVDRIAPGGLAVMDPKQDLLTRGRPSIAVDLKRPEGVAVVLDLVEHADALIEGFRPGVAERLGIGPQACLHRNPRLAYGRITGWGQDGPLAATAGHDINYIAVAGALGALGRNGAPPQIPLNLIGDFAGGSLYLVVGLLAATLEARSSGRGQVVDAAMVDGVAHLMTLFTALRQADLWRDRPGTNLLDGGAPFYDVYVTADGGYMSVGALEPQFYAELIRRLGVEDAPSRDDEQNWPQLRAIFETTFASRTQAEWTEVFADSDACVSPVTSPRQAPDEPHLAARGTFVENAGVVQPAPAPRFSETPAALGLPPSRPGEHTRSALAAWGVQDVDELVRNGVVIQA